MPRKPPRAISARCAPSMAVLNFAVKYGCMPRLAMVRVAVMASAAMPPLSVSTSRVRVT